MVRRGLAADLEAASDLIASGRVLVGGAPTLTPQRLTDDGEPVRVLADRRFVGRGGDKLRQALDDLALDELSPSDRAPSDPAGVESASGGTGVAIEGEHALDVGSSTGGFTDCLLQAGAAAVVAVDVGTHQLHERLRDDPRVTVLEQTDIRSLDHEAVGAPFSVVTVDVSFISVCSIVESLAELTATDGNLVVLVKPQFEVDHIEASRGRGVIREPGLWRSALETVTRSAEERGLRVVGATVSAVKGAQGNTEFFVRLRHDGAPGDTQPLGEDWIDLLLASAEGDNGQVGTDDA